jgi:hypothetical protein
MLRHTPQESNVALLLFYFTEFPDVKEEKEKEKGKEKETPKTKKSKSGRIGRNRSALAMKAPSSLLLVTETPPQVSEIIVREEDIRGKSRIISVQLPYNMID